MPLFKKKYLSWIGPYPYNPTLIFLFFTFVYFSRYLPALIRETAGTDRWLAVLVIFVLSALPSAAFALFAIVLKKYRFWSSESLVGYLVEVAMGIGIILIFAPVSSNFIRDEYELNLMSLAAVSPGLLFGAYLLGLLALALMNFAERSIVNRLKVADDLVKKLETDRSELVAANESLRQQTARFLHDRVQADLMVAGIELKNIAEQNINDSSEAIKKVVSKLEATRFIDLRNLTQILAPNFQTNGIVQALHLLAGQYKAGMRVWIKVDDASEDRDTQTQLGMFRIVEQALLNALVHGPAKAVNVSVETDSLGATLLKVSDDGPGSSPEGIVAGGGTAVIDSWVGVLRAKKTIQSVPGHGYQLEIRIPNTEKEL